MCFDIAFVLRNIRCVCYRSGISVKVFLPAFDSADDG